MATIRTQISLTEDQRRRLEVRMQRDATSVAAVIREAIEAYLADDRPDARAALDATFGMLPNLVTRSRDDRERG